MPVVEKPELWFARNTLRDFIDGVALARSIAELGEHPPYSFTIAQRCAFNEAVSAWCILFGSDHAGHQPIHWKQQFDVKEFRAELLDRIGMSLNDWRDYRGKVVAYRNDLVAHRSLEPRPEFHPNFDTALLASDYYHGCLQAKAVVAGGKMEGDPLLVQFAERLELCRRQIRAAVAAA